MRPDDISSRLRVQTFQPIRLYISDGSFYDIHHPELVMVGRTEVVIGLKLNPNFVVGRFAYVDPIHITRIEPIAEKGNGKPKRSRRRKGEPGQ
ncbi:MAG: hypothetical protein HYR83_03275 [Planctomycetes bacterium]|nr:hypothetical protein [Planctomycetota bacterium]